MFNAFNMLVGGKMRLWSDASFLVEKKSYFPPSKV